MRISAALCGTAALAIALGLALSTTSAQAKHMKMKPKPAVSAALIAKGKGLISSKHCNSCHSADLKGKKGFSPSLYGNARPMTEYNQTTFVRLMTTGLDDDKKPVKPPMNNACHQTPADSKAMFAYLKTLK